MGMDDVNESYECEPHRAKGHMLDQGLGAEEEVFCSAGAHIMQQRNLRQHQSDQCEKLDDNNNGEDSKEQPQPLRVAIVHPDLGLGGAERLIVDAAAALVKRSNSVTVFTARHDKTRCFEETIDGTFQVCVHGDWYVMHVLILLCWEGSLYFQQQSQATRLSA